MTSHLTKYRTQAPQKKNWKLKLVQWLKQMSRNIKQQQEVIN